jgi:hypothetical protein
VKQEGGMMDQGQGRQTVTGLVRDLTDQIGRLLQDEFALLKAEAREKAGQAGKGATMIGVGAGFGLCTLLLLLAAAVMALSQVMEPWAAALVVAAGSAVLTLVFIFTGKAAMRADRLAPQRTVSSVQADIRFTKQHLKGSV